MSDIMDVVNQRTQLAGKNRMELLLFHFGEKQRFGINVFKVREVIPAPVLSRIPHANSVVRGIASIRGQTIPVLDLLLATHGRPLPAVPGSSEFVIVTEYNRTIQGFLVRGVDRILNINWEQILPPPSQGIDKGYLTAVTCHEGHIIEIIDVEKVWAEIQGPSIIPSADDELLSGAEHWHVLVVDDSSVARRQIMRTVTALGLGVTSVNDGQEALDILWKWLDEGDPRWQQLLMVISDVEMPRMDGYTLTARIREESELKRLYVLLHSSLSGVFNESMVKRVGADEFLAKFHSNELAERVRKRLVQVQALMTEAP